MEKPVMRVRSHGEARVMRVRSHGEARVMRVRSHGEASHEGQVTWRSQS